MQFLIHGARGSSPVSGSAFARYGGHTSCYEVVLSDGHRVIFDGGTGLLHLQSALSTVDAANAFEATVFLTHFHWDHIQGLPFFKPLYSPTSRIRFVAIPPPGHTIDSALDGAIQPPWFPVRLRDAAAALTFEPLPAQPLRIGEIEISGVPLHHPGGVTAYRIASGGRALVIATDVEPDGGVSDRALRALADGANVLVHDAQYTPLEWSTTRSGWGHSTWEHATTIAQAAQVQRLILTSHDPDRSDDAVDAILQSARTVFAPTDAASEGQAVEF